MPTNGVLHHNERGHASRSVVVLGHSDQVRTTIVAVDDGSTKIDIDDRRRYRGPFPTCVEYPKPTYMS